MVNFRVGQLAESDGWYVLVFDGARPAMRAFGPMEEREAERAAGVAQSVWNTTRKFRLVADRVKTVLGHQTHDQLLFRIVEQEGRAATTGKGGLFDETV